MKKLIFILLLLLISCGGSYQKPEASSESDSVWLMLQEDSTLLDKEILLKTLAIDSPIVQPETLSVQKDTIKPSSRKMIQTKLDTTSYIPELKANVEKINYQQKQLDTLLKRKK